MDEARMEESEYGRVAATEGWFTVNVRDAAWVQNEYFGDACIFEGDKARFPEIGYTLCVLQPNGMYHREGNQEDFLVLQGEALLIVEGQEGRLKAWDFFHSPAGTDHILVGAGEEPCLVRRTRGQQRLGPHALRPQRDRVPAGRGPRARHAALPAGLRSVPQVGQRPATDVQGLPFA